MEKVTAEHVACQARCQMLIGRLLLVDAVEGRCDWAADKSVIKTPAVEGGACAGLLLWSSSRCRGCGGGRVVTRRE